MSQLACNDNRITDLIPAVQRAIAVWVKDPDDRDDLVQEVMIRLWTHRAHLPAIPRQLTRWVYTTARNLAIDHFRAHKREQRLRDFSVVLDITGTLRATSGEQIPIAQPASPLRADAVHTLHLPRRHPTRGGDVHG